MAKVSLRSVPFIFAEQPPACRNFALSLPGSASAILRAARQVGVPIVRILLTHAHTDHVGSLDALCNALPKTESFIGISEAPLLAGVFSAYGCRRGRRPFGFLKTRSHPKKVLE